MGPLDLAIHLLNFAAPAGFLALAMTLAGRWLLPGAGGLGWWRQFALNFVAGVAVLLGGLWFFGVDGKMATYAALVVAVASCQWLAARGWRR